MLGAALLAAGGLAGCGGDQDAGRARPASVPPALVQSGVDPAAVRVVRTWADTLRRGDVATAARSFAVPSLVANGGPPERLTTSAAILAFNQSLPCGARLVRADRAPRGFVIATFLLTERPGPGACGSGTGATARTAFRVRDGRITDWLRVQDLPRAETSPV